MTASESEVTGKVVDLNTINLPVEERRAYRPAFLQSENLWQHSEKAGEPVLFPRAARLAADLTDVDGVRFHYDRALG